MSKFTRETKLAKVVIENHRLLPVLNRFEIKLGFKDKTIEEVCQDRNINLDFFLAIINTYTNESALQEEQFLSFSPLEIIDYLKKTHQYYINYAIPRLDELLQSMIESSNESSEGLDMIQKFYTTYKDELLHHIQEEEALTFPNVVYYVKNGAYKNDGFSIESYGEEHTNVDIKLEDLTNLIIKYIKPTYDPNLCNTFLQELFLFEKDMKDHARIEDHILVNQIIQLEKAKA